MDAGLSLYSQSSLMVDAAISTVPLKVSRTKVLTDTLRRAERDGLVARHPDPLPAHRSSAGSLDVPPLT
jgi:hypothetical protein